MRTSLTPQELTVRYGFLGAVRVPLQDIAPRRGGGVPARSRLRRLGVARLRTPARRQRPGNRAVLVTRRDGSTLLVGSMDPRQLLAALATAGVATEDKLPADIRSF
jgi:hypothetical protein